MTTKHSGINATRDVLRRELARSADGIIALRAQLPMPGGIILVPHTDDGPWPIRIATLAGFALGCFVTAVAL